MLSDGMGAHHLVFGEEHPGSCMAALCWQSKYSLLATHKMNVFHKYRICSRCFVNYLHLTWVFKRRGVTSLKAGEHKVHGKSHFPKQSRILKQSEMKTLFWEISTLRRLDLSLLILVLKSGKKPATIQSSSGLYLAKELPVQFQAAAIKFTLLNLVALDKSSNTNVCLPQKAAVVWWYLSVIYIPLGAPPLLLVYLLHLVSFSDGSEPWQWWKVSVSFVGRAVGLHLGSVFKRHYHRCQDISWVAGIE